MCCLYPLSSANCSCVLHIKPSGGHDIRTSKFKGKIQLPRPIFEVYNISVLIWQHTQTYFFSSQPSLLDFDWGVKNITSKIELLQHEVLLQTTTPKCFNAYGDMVRKSLTFKTIFELNFRKFPIPAWHRIKRFTTLSRTARCYEPNNKVWHMEHG